VGQPVRLRLLMTLGLIYATVIGLLLGLTYCYWKQITTAYQNRDIIQQGSDLFGQTQSFVDTLKQKL
jgi:hypothetical protein